MEPGADSSGGVGVSGGIGAAGSVAHGSVRRMRLLMGTWVIIEAQAASGGSPTAASAAARAIADDQAASAAGLVTAIEQAFAALADIAVRMHPQREGSDLARIASAPLNTPIEIDPSTWRVLQRAKEIHEWSAGVFDACLPSRAGRLSDIELTTPGQVVCRRPVALDLGGIAKGYAVDQAVSVLQASGCVAGIVNAGGDLRVFGPGPQTILVRRGVRAYIPVQLSNAALAVSDVEGSSPPAEHRGYYNRAHQLDTRQTAGKHTTTLRQHYAAIVAADAMTADALTKCALLCSQQRLEELLARIGARELDSFTTVPNP